MHKTTSVPSAVLFRFGDGFFLCLENGLIRIPAPDISFFLRVDNAKPHFPLLIGIDVLENSRLVADNVKNESKRKIRL